jgi:hypothetical protein
MLSSVELTTIPYHLPSGSDVSDPGLHPDPSAPSGFGGAVVVAVGSVVVVGAVVTVVTGAVVVVVDARLVVDGAPVVVAPSPPVPQAAKRSARARNASRHRVMAPIQPN